MANELQHTVTVTSDGLCVNIKLYTENHYTRTWTCVNVSAHPCNDFFMLWRIRDCLCYNYY